MTEVKRAPVPWTASPIDIGNDWIIHADGSGIHIAYLTSHRHYRAQAEDNAAFIVKAVNCHEELVAMLAVCREALVVDGVLTKESRLILDIDAALSKAGATP